MRKVVFFLLCGSAVGYALYLMPQALVFKIVNARSSKTFPALSPRRWTSL